MWESLIPCGFYRINPDRPRNYGELGIQATIWSYLGSWWNGQGAQETGTYQIQDSLLFIYPDSSVFFKLLFF